MRAAIEPVGGKDKLFAIGGEHGEGIETTIVRYFLQPCSIQVYDIQVKGKAAGIFIIGSEDDVLTIGCEIGRPVGFAKMGDLVYICSICIGHEYFHLGGHDKAFCIEVVILFYFFRRGGAGSAPDDLFTIG